MDQTDFAIAMVSGVIIIIAIFLFILFKIFDKKKKSRSIVTLLPDMTKIETHETRPGKFEIKPQEIEGLEKEFRLARDVQKKGSGKDLMGRQKEDTSSVEPEKKMEPLNETTPFERIREEILKEDKEPNLKYKKEEPRKETKEKPLKGSSEENEKLKLEDILIEIRDENTQTKAKKKSSSGKNIEKADKLKIKEISEKKPLQKQDRKKSEKDQVAQATNVSEEKSSRKKPPGKRPGKKVIKTKKVQAIVNENPV